MQMKSRFVTRLLSAVICVGTLVVANAYGDELAVQVKGRDDGTKSTRINDYNEAVLSAQIQVLERAGVIAEGMTHTQQITPETIASQAEAVLTSGYKILDMGYQNDGAYLVILSGKINRQQPGYALLVALQFIQQEPTRYALTLAPEGGKSVVTKAYFLNDKTFVIHFGKANGTVTLKGVESGLMTLSGKYVTAKDKGILSLDFNADGSAQGRWENNLTQGVAQLSKRK
jgi:hypothetical protein